MNSCTLAHACASESYLSEDSLTIKDVEKPDFSNVQNPAYIAFYGCSTAGSPDSITDAFANRLKQPVIGIESGLSFGLPLCLGTATHNIALFTLFPGIIRGDRKIITPKNYVKPNLAPSFSPFYFLPEP